MYKFSPVVYLAGVRLSKWLTWWSLKIGVTGNSTKNGVFDTSKTELVGSKHLIMNTLTQVQGGSEHHSPTYSGEMKDAFEELWRGKREFPTGLDLSIPYQRSRASWSAWELTQAAESTWVTWLSSRFNPTALSGCTVEPVWIYRLHGITSTPPNGHLQWKFLTQEFPTPGISLLIDTNL